MLDVSSQYQVEQLLVQQKEKTQKLGPGFVLNVKGDIEIMLQEDK